MVNCRLLMLLGLANMPWVIRQAQRLALALVVPCHFTCRLAFDTIEKIVREHFNHITETETTTFTDCVNCLIAFTNNPHSLDVALNSIAFLR